MQQAAILFQSLCNRFRALVAETVAVLHRTRYLQATRQHNMRKNYSTKQNVIEELTKFNDCKLLFSFRASAIAFAPESPTWLNSCTQ